MNERQRKFVEGYMAHGNGTQAALDAGYAKSSAHVTATRLLKNDKIVDAMEERQESDPAVATREERQRLWTSMMRGEEQAGNVRPDIRERLKASELLAKSGGDFVERSEGNLTIRVVREPVPDLLLPEHGGDGA